MSDMMSQDTKRELLRHFDEKAKPMVGNNQRGGKANVDGRLNCRPIASATAMLTAHRGSPFVRRRHAGTSRCSNSPMARPGSQQPLDVAQLTTVAAHRRLQRPTGEARERLDLRRFFRTADKPRHHRRES